VLEMQTNKEGDVLRWECMNCNHIE
jgi:hypothetical protein